MAAAAVVNLCTAATAAINAAAAANAFVKPITAYEDYALNIALEAVQDWKVGVQPGPSRSKPATLDGCVLDMISVRIVIVAILSSPQDVDGVKAGLLLTEQIFDQVCDRLSQTYCFIEAGPESKDQGPQAYDQERLRNDGVFEAQYLISFDAVRDHG